MNPYKHDDDYEKNIQDWINYFRAEGWYGELPGMRKIIPIETLRWMAKLRVEKMMPAPKIELSPCIVTDLLYNKDVSDEEQYSEEEELEIKRKIRELHEKYSIPVSEEYK